MPGANGRTDVLDWPAGLNGLVFKTSDSDGAYAALQEAGVPVLPPQAFSRPVEMPGGPRDAAFRTVRLEPRRRPRGPHVLLPPPDPRAGLARPLAPASERRAGCPARRHLRRRPGRARRPVRSPVRRRQRAANRRWLQPVRRAGPHRRGHSAALDVEFGADAPEPEAATNSWRRSCSARFPGAGVPSSARRLHRGDAGQPRHHGCCERGLRRDAGVPGVNPPIARRPAGSFRNTVCPHDCPSTCALEVEVLDRTRIGAVRGAADNSYTAGVICAKVARYAERHAPPGPPDPPPAPHAAPRAAASSAPIGWDEALDRVAAAFTDAGGPARRGDGLAVLLRRHHGPRAAGRHQPAAPRHGLFPAASTICSSAHGAGLDAPASAGITGPDPREMAQSDLVVMWGGNPVATQVNVMTHVTRARKQRGAKFVVVDPYRTPTAAAADMHLALRPGTDAALACAVMHVRVPRRACRPRLHGPIRRLPGAAGGAPARPRRRPGPLRSPGLRSAEIEAFAALLQPHRAGVPALGYGFAARRNGAPTCTPSPACPP